MGDTAVPIEDKVVWKLPNAMLLFGPRKKWAKARIIPKDWEQ